MPAMSRNTSLDGYEHLVRELGADPLPLLRASRIDPADLVSLDRWLSVDDVADLLERTAAETNCPDFGLRLSDRSRLSSLGPVGLVAREESTVRAALNLLIRCMHLYHEGLRARISAVGELAIVQVDLVLDTPAHRLRQGMEMTLGVCHRIIGSLLGDDWQPVSVYTTYPLPADPASHHRVFGPNVEFSQRFNGVVMYAAELDRPNTLADPNLRPYTHELLRMIGPRGVTVTDRATALVEELLPTGRCSLERVARTAGLQSRTLQRHLAGDGKSFSELLDEVRVRQARRHVGNTDRSLTEVAEMLGFSSIGTFSRWFRGRFGASASAWRAGESAARVRGA